MALEADATGDDVARGISTGGSPLWYTSWVSSEVLDEQVQAVVRRLADRDRLRSEATIQADVRSLLLDGGLNLADHDLTVDLETQVGDQRRIDVEVGFTVVEVKRDLRSQRVIEQAIVQLAGYVEARSEQTRQRYVGLLTDGAEWRAYQLVGDQLAEVSRYELRTQRPDGLALLAWLEGVLATGTHVPPRPDEIATRLGADSSSHVLARADLASLYQQHRLMPTVQLKRELWAKLLRSALGTQFSDDDSLFIEHTLLVNTAEIIAHLVLGLDVRDMTPASLLRGQHFERAQIYGVVEQDFFDWILEVPDGEAYVRTLARRVARFDWRNVEHDVLKVLYESVIGTETRKRLGEYYTPDWLAEHIVKTAVTEPLVQRVLDPACGSGTFLFHAVRRYLAASEQQGDTLSVALTDLSNRVVGIDLHPVAVALARVTYLLAIGPERLVDRARPAISVPVYLGDSMQWQHQTDLLNQGDLVIPTDDGDQLFSAELRFPEELLQDAAGFDRLVDGLTKLAARPRNAGSRPSLTSLFNRLVSADRHRPTIQETFAVLCRLHDDGRNHIWSYYVRNLARPMWLSRSENRVDVLVGNPPWLAYRHMPTDMQVTFQQMSRSRGLWHGKEVATHQDLSGLFVARTVEQYLSTGGRFAFVMPNAALDRGYYAGFRAGRYYDQLESTEIAFSGSWDLRRLRPHFFPRGSCVIFGSRVDRDPVALPVQTERWSGRVPRLNENWLAVLPFITRGPALLRVSTETFGVSPYGPRFRQGATIVPRMLSFVDEQKAGPLGWGAGRRAVRSSRSSYENPPWKDLPRLEGVVEAEFVRSVLLSENVLPYRLLPARRAVLPLEGSNFLDGSHSHLDLYPGLAEWWRSAEEIWMKNRTSDRLTLAERLDFRFGLTEQVPPPPLRVVYGASGMHVSAALVEDPDVIIEHGLYWGAVTSREEGYYLCAILNSPILTYVVRPLMSYGKDERHIDKHVWKLPLTLYEVSNPDHVRLSELGQQQADVVAALDLDEQGNFVTLRRQVRQALEGTDTAIQIGTIVEGMLG